ncbi:MAG: M20/M25/M40 family metallo-hydrolase [Oscillospiraceae bacterium]
MYELIKKLCDLPGISGRERAVTDEIERIAREYTREIERDALGNLIVRKRGAKTPSRPVMVAAHTDEVGFMVSDIDDDGLLSLVSVGGTYGHTLSGRSLILPRSGLAGILGGAPLHLRHDNLDEIPKLDDMYLDIGASSKEQAEKYVRRGDAVLFDTKLARFGDDNIIGKAIDDRLGCAIMLELLRENLPCDVTFAFTVQEELGLRGAKTAAFSVRPGTAIVLDVGGGADNAGFEGAARIALQGAGPIISFMDRATIYDEKLYEAACRLADDNNIPRQTKTRVSGGTDAGAIHCAAAGARVVGISIAGRNIHTSASSVSLSDTRNAFELAKLMLGHLSDV